ncbi:unnamed protein product, partial [Ectocarpus sp. 13 AM-2016]
CIFALESYCVRWERRVAPIRAFPAVVIWLEACRCPLNAWLHAACLPNGYSGSVNQWFSCAAAARTTSTLFTRQENNRLWASALVAFVELAPSNGTRLMRTTCSTGN